MSDTLTRAAQNGQAAKDTKKGTNPTVIVEPAPSGNLRRRPMRAVVAIAIAAACGLIVAYLFTAVASTSSVLVVSQPVTKGAVITAADLSTAQVNDDPAVATIPASQGSDVVGTRAAIDLVPGALLTDGSITSQLVPAIGQSVVGMQLSPGQLPAMGLTTGDQVRIVTTPRAQDDPPTTAPATLAATVAAVYPPDVDGKQQVDFTVPQGSAALLAANGATQRVVVILDPRER